MLKKLGIGLGVLFFLLLVTIITIPFVVDVDKYRPQLLEAANKQINGKLEIFSDCLVFPDRTLYLSTFHTLVVNMRSLLLFFRYGIFAIGERERIERRITTDKKREKR